MFSKIFKTGWLVIIIASLTACATKEQRVERDYLRLIHNSEMAVELGKEEIKIGEATIVRGQKRIKEGQANIAAAKKDLELLLNAESKIEATQNE